MHVHIYALLTLLLTTSLRSKKISSPQGYFSRIDIEIYLIKDLDCFNLKQLFQIIKLSNFKKL
jgi:hypothetical protein